MITGRNVLAVEVHQSAPDDGDLDRIHQTFFQKAPEEPSTTEQPDVLAATRAAKVLHRWLKVGPYYSHTGMVLRLQRSREHVGFHTGEFTGWLLHAGRQVRGLAHGGVVHAQIVADLADHHVHGRGRPGGDGLVAGLFRLRAPGDPALW